MENQDKTFETVVNIIIRLGFLLLLLAWCFQILAPFINPVVWALLLAIVLEPMNKSLSKKIGSKKWSAILLTIVLLAIIIVPSYLFFDSIVGGAKEIGTAMENNTLKVPPPTDKVKDWPLIGEDAYNAWYLASENLDAALEKYSEQVSNSGRKLISSIVGLASGILQFVISVIIAGVLMASYDSASQATRKLFRRIIGKRKAGHLVH